MSMPTGRKLAFLIEATILILMIFTAMTEVCPEVSRRLLRWAARRCFAAGPVRARFEEEWLADLEEVPGKPAKLAHAVGVLVFTAAPLWARSRWGRSRLAGWLNRVTTGLRPAPVVISGDNGGAVLARAGAIALALAAAGLVTAQYIQSAPQASHAPDAGSRASGASALWFVSPTAFTPGGPWANFVWRPMGSGTEVAASVSGIPVGTTVRLYVIAEDGRVNLIAKSIAGFGKSSAWYFGATTLTRPEINSFEVTVGTAPPSVFMAAPDPATCALPGFVHEAPRLLNRTQCQTE